jgi:hypothetical protein
MEKMVVSCLPDGSVQHLLKDSFLDPFPGQPREIKRLTEVLPTTDGRHFYISWLLGPFAGKKHSNGIAHLILSYASRNEAPPMNPDTMLFDSYEEAVAHEIECVNSLRLKGITF